MARWIRFEVRNDYGTLRRGGEDGLGNVRFDRSPCPTVTKTGGSISGTSYWHVEDDGDPEDGCLPEEASVKKMRIKGRVGTGNPDEVIGPDEPAPTIQRHGAGDQRSNYVTLEDDGRPDEPPPAQPEKPPYRIPTMAEIAAVPKNGLTVMSTFSGCGGSCLGYEWAGYTPLLACEFVPSAVESYKANHPGVPVYDQDIRELTAERALELMGLQRGELDVLEGSPPCESFSTSGKLSAGWGHERDYSDGKKQRMDDLFYEFTRLLGGIQPRAFMAENVSGLVKGVSKGYFKLIHAELARQGYRVQAQMLDAQWLGVPQRRQRVIFVGVRDDLGLDPPFPKPLAYRYSIRDALAGLSAIQSLTWDSSSAWHDKEDVPLDGPSPTIVKDSAQPHHLKVERIVYDNGGKGGAAQTGRAEEDLQPGEVVRVHRKGHGYFPGDVTDGGDVLPTVTKDAATGIGSAYGEDGYVVERVPGPADDGGGGEIVALRDQQFEGRDLSVDDPIPTVLRRGATIHIAAGGGGGQFALERKPPEEALGDVERVTGRIGSQFVREDVDVDAPAPTIQKSGAELQRFEVERKPTQEELVRDGKPLASGVLEEWRGLQPGETSDKYANLERSHPDRPVGTVTRVGGSGGLATVTHPHDPRKFSIAELRRLCGFPDDFHLAGSYAQQWERLGNAVPPPMAMHVAAAIAEGLPS